MTLPKLAIPASGFGGRGYKHPITGEIVPSVTTVLKAEAKPAVVQWAVDQTAGYAIANAEKLLGMSDSASFRFLRFYHSRKVNLTADTNINDWHVGVLDDSANLGTSIHEWIQADVTGTTPYPDVSNQPVQFWEMVDAWDSWKVNHDIKAHHTETTVFNAEAGYAGTADLMWVFDGEYTLGDIKTAKGIYSSHRMQLAALYYAPELLLEYGGEYAGVTAWQEPITRCGFLKVRPDFVGKDGVMVPRHVEWVPAEHMEQYYRAFVGLVDYTWAMRSVNDSSKGK